MAGTNSDADIGLRLEAGFHSWQTHFLRGRIAQMHLPKCTNQRLQNDQGACMMNSVLGLSLAEIECNYMRYSLNPDQQEMTVLPKALVGN